MAARLRPFVKFFGSKWRLSKLYPVPRFNCIIEPFAGGANYAMHHILHGFTGKVILNDADVRICNLWNYLKNATKQDILDLPLLQDKEVGTDIFSLGLPEGASELIIRWQRMGINRCSTVSAWNGKTGQWDASIRKTIADNVHLLRDIEVSNLSFADMQNIECCWFIDPPYQSNIVKYEASSVPLNYSVLSDWCKQRNGQIIVCEQSPADWLPFTVLKDNVPGKMQKVMHSELVFVQ